MLWPAAKQFDGVIGVDLHMQIFGFPIHPYLGPIYMWMTPKWPGSNVFINNCQAASVGAMGYFFHIPQGIPSPTTIPNIPYWLHVVKKVVLMVLTTMANVAIGASMALIPMPGPAERFMRDVTGIDTTSKTTIYQSALQSFAVFTKWQTWVKLLMPPIPYPGAQGSTSVGSPNVTVNGGPLAFSGPLNASSCSDIPIIPNANTIGFSNVMVGVSLAQLARGIAVNMAQEAIEYAIEKPVGDAIDSRWRERNQGCGEVGEPIDVVSGANVDEFLDFTLVKGQPFEWRRFYSTSDSNRDSDFGPGFRHPFEATLRYEVDTFQFLSSRGVQIAFPVPTEDQPCVAADGYVLQRLDSHRFRIEHGYEDALVFNLFDAGKAARLESVGDARLNYSPSGVLDGISLSGERQLVIQREKGRIVRIDLREDADQTVRTVSTYVYDDEGRLTSWTDAFGASSAYSYDGSTRMTRKQDRNGYGFNYQYDDSGRCVHTFGDDGLHDVRLEYQIESLLTKAHFPDGGVVTYIYNRDGTIVSIVDPYGGLIERKIDALGRVQKEVFPDGSEVHFLYDETGFHVGRVDQFGAIYPPLGLDANPAPIRNATVPDCPLHWTLGLAPQGAETPRTDAAESSNDEREHGNFQLAPDGKLLKVRFDSLGRLEEVTDPSTGLSEQWSFDPNGNPTRYSDFDGVVERRAYTSWNLLEREIDGLGNELVMEYSPREQLTQVTDPGGTVSQYEYDKKDRLAKVRRHGVLREQYEYDEGDNLVKKLDGDGNVLLSMTIGKDHLPDTRTLASGEVHLFEYDERGRRTRMSTAISEVTRQYNGDHLSADLKDGQGVRHGIADGCLRTTTLFDKFEVYYNPGDSQTVILDPTGREHTVSVGLEGAFERTHPDGIRERREYDAEGRMISRLNWTPGKGQDGKRFCYSPSGDLNEVQHASGGITRIRYDGAHRLQKIVRPNGLEEDFRFDAAGNLTSKPGLSGVAFQEGNRIQSANGSSFRFNSRNHIGERSAIEGTTSFHYDSKDRLIAATLPSGHRWEAEYDAIGRRLSKTTTEGKTEFYWDGNRLAAEIGPEGGLRMYVYPNQDALVPMMFIDYESVDAEPESGQQYFLIADHLGMPELVYDSNGEVVWSGQGGAFGEVVVDPSSQIELNLRWPGHYFDTETGLHYNRHRYYSPELGRYLQSDPLGTEGGVNLYAYSVSPLVEVDLNGLQSHNQRNRNRNKEGEEDADAETPRRIIIGEGMGRIKEYARANNARWYQAWSRNFPTNRRMTPAELDAALARNERWIRSKIDDGYEIIDIGPDGRPVRSPFYQRELDVLEETGYDGVMTQRQFEGPARDRYMGATPRKDSRTGKEVIARMEADGKIVRDASGQPTQYMASDGEWYSIDTADMSHTTDAVTYWNDEGRYTGPKSPEVRDFMLDPDNYVLDHRSINRSDGAKLDEVYLPPDPGGKAD